MSNCELCGEPLPEGETMFKFHGYSGPCPKLPKTSIFENENLQKVIGTTVQNRVVDELKSNPFITGSDLSDAYEKGWEDAISAQGKPR